MRLTNSLAYQRKRGCGSAIEKPALDVPSSARRRQTSMEGRTTIPGDEDPACNLEAACDLVTELDRRRDPRQMTNECDPDVNDTVDFIEFPPLTTGTMKYTGVGETVRNTKHPHLFIFGICTGSKSLVA